MKPNIDRAGRVMRAALGAMLLVAGLLFLSSHWIVALVLLLSAVFCFFEAARGWCAARACGIKTPL